jgi:hypothetical protein
MLGIPKYPFRVYRYYRIGSQMKEECKNFEKLGSALTYRDSCIQDKLTVRVLLCTVLDEYVKSNGGHDADQQHSRVDRFGLRHSC